MFQIFFYKLLIYEKYEIQIYVLGISSLFSLLKKYIT